MGSSSSSEMIKGRGFKVLATFRPFLSQVVFRSLPRWRLPPLRCDLRLFLSSRSSLRWGETRIRRLDSKLWFAAASWLLTAASKLGLTRKYKGSCHANSGCMAVTGPNWSREALAVDLCLPRQATFHAESVESRLLRCSCPCLCHSS